MEEVNDNNIQRQLPLMVLSSNLEQLVLSLIPQLALPKTKAILGHLRRSASDGGVCLENLCWGVIHYDPVVQSAGDESFVCGKILAKDSPPDCRVIP